MGILSYGYKASKTPVGKKVVDTVKNIFTGGKQKTYGTGAINKVDPNVPVTKGDKLKRDINIAVQKSKASQAKLDNTIFRIEQQKKRLEEKKAKGGRVGLKGGSDFPDYSGDGKTTMKDILMGRGVIPKPKNKKKMVAKKTKTPIEKAIKKNKKKII
jgi:hypothetical protein